MTEAVEAWARSGAMALTGLPDGPPLVGPLSLPPFVVGLQEAVERLTSGLGVTVSLDAMALLGERAAITGRTRAGRTSCGGATRLLRAADGWVAVTLARPDDLDVVPAWLGLDGPPAGDVWERVRTEVARGRAGELVAWGRTLGLPVARLGETTPPGTPMLGQGDSRVALPVRPAWIGPARPVRALGELVVADLSSLWAGPLCGQVLTEAGARVVKVEDTSRPDGARRGPRAFFDLMNGGKESVRLDLRSGVGKEALRRLVSRADVVIEASRPRALRQLGIHAEDVLRTGSPKIWISITGYGRREPYGERVAFGDDAAVSGGLVAWTGDVPFFCADAVADPLTGLVAATACLTLLGGPGRWLVDIAMAEVAARAATAEDMTGHACGDPGGWPCAAAPRARRPRARGPAPGSHTRRVLGDLGLA
ncbi:CoA transferase [Nonomuraea sp. NPDC002799]